MTKASCMPASRAAARCCGRARYGVAADVDHAVEVEHRQVVAVTEWLLRRAEHGASSAPGVAAPYDAPMDSDVVATPSMVARPLRWTRSGR